MNADKLRKLFIPFSTRQSKYAGKSAALKYCPSLEQVMVKHPPLKHGSLPVFQYGISHFLITGGGGGGGGGSGGNGGTVGSYL